MHTPDSGIKALYTVLTFNLLLVRLLNWEKVSNKYNQENCFPSRCNWQNKRVVILRLVTTLGIRIKNKLVVYKDHFLEAGLHLQTSNCECIRCIFLIALIALCNVKEQWDLHVIHCAVLELLDYPQTVYVSNELIAQFQVKKHVIHKTMFTPLM